MRERSGKAWVVAVLMGLGHLRAAVPLKDIADGGIILYGSRRFTPPAEYRRWRRLRRFYYLFSRAGRVPVIGRIVLSLMLALEKIPPFYPQKDRSRPNAAVRYVEFLIRKKGLCAALLERIRTPRHPVIHTFYATAVALDTLAPGGQEQYLMICDADINRLWVPRDPRRSRLTFLAPCTQVRQRLLSYGVREERIHLTGFPLPKENIGSGERLEILRDDLFERLLRRTDLVWTKPSELSFYCALGLPILMAPPIGTHEERNRRWLEELHAGVEPAGRVEDCREWLFDLRENGRLAEAAWGGFLKARKLGTYKIEHLIRTGEFVEGQGPLEQ
jgi:hypothetical protein